eukprot:Em0002g807a
MRKDLGPRCYEFGCQNLAILILGMILAKIVPKIISLGGGRSRISALVRNIFVATRIQTAPQTALKLVKYQSSSSQRTQRQHPQAPLLLPASPQQGVPTTQSEPPTTQARRCASSSTLVDATKEQSATLSTSSGSQAVVETPPPRPAQVLHQWLPELQRGRLRTLAHSWNHHSRRQSTKHPDLMQLLRTLFLVAAQHSFTIRLSHLPSRLNSIADVLSRKNLPLFFTLAPQADPQLTPIPRHLTKTRTTISNCY